jgi:hypothetical protein
MSSSAIMTLKPPLPALEVDTPLAAVAMEVATPFKAASSARAVAK